jgi:RNA polymerase sigma-70 factor (ECF subfamily)
MEVHALRKVLEALPVGDRIILLMKYQDDMQIKEIAALTSKSESAVKMQILRAKEKAKKLREEQGIENE